MKDEDPKPVRWIGSSRKDSKAFPARIRSDIGKALYAAQRGETDPAAKPLKGAVSRGGLRFACLSEEIEKRNSDAKT